MASSNDIDVLQEMGFSRNGAERALAKSGNQGVQLAMDWLFAHADDPDLNDPYTAPQGHVLGKPTEGATSDSGAEAGQSSGETRPAAEGMETNEEGEGPAPQAMSLKCEDCGKLLKSEMDAQSHAARTKHTNFSESTEEIKPLTKEEKEQQLQKLQDKLQQRRREREEKEKQEAISREKSRRTTGKDITQIKQKMQDDEIRRLAELKRKEKEEEKMARQKVKEQIERDKRERAAKFSKSSESIKPATAPAPAASPAAAPAQPAEKKDYDQTRIQLRLTNGQSLTQSFGAKEPLAAVRLYLQLNRTDGDASYSLMMPFPRKVFTEDDMPRPLSDLGLVPSAVLVLTKSQ